MQRGESETMKTNEEQGAERATISERIKEWNALTDEEREARRSRSVCCPEGHPEVWNPQDPIQEWARCMTQTACRHLIAVLAPESTTTNKERDDGSTTTGG